MAFTVEWAEPALGDLMEIVEHAHEESPRRSRRFFLALRAAAASLERLLLRGRIVPELRAVGRSSHRELIVSPYRLVHRIEAKTVYVVGVFDGRRKLDVELMKRMVRPR